MNVFLEMIFDVLFHPRQAMNVISSSANVGHSLIIFLISESILLWGILLGADNKGLFVPIPLIFVIQLFISFVLWYLFSAVFHLGAELLGGKGTASGLFSAVGFAYVPRIFLVPLWVLAAFVPNSSVVAMLSVFIVIVWTLWLFFEAIRQSHQLSSVRSFCVLIFPFVIAMLFFTLVAAIISMIFSKLPFWFGQSL